MKKFNLLLFLWFFLFIFSASCNQSKQSTVTPSVFASKIYKAKSSKEKIIFLDSISECCLPTQNDSLTRNFLLKLSSEYYYLNHLQKSLKISKDIRRYAVESADSNALATSNYYIGDSFEPTRKDSAYFYYLEAENIYRKLNNLEETGRMKFNKAVLLFFEGNYVESEIEVAGALQLLEDSSDKPLLFSCYNLMGSNFEKLEDYDNAMKYYLKAKDILNALRQENKSFDRQYNYAATSSVNIANIYEKTSRYSKSVEELNLVLNDDLKQNWPSAYAVAVGNLGYTKMKMGQRDGVEELLLEALHMSQRHDSENQLTYKLNNLGEFYAINGDTAKSIEYLQKSLAIWEKSKGGEEIKSTLKLLSRVDPVNSPNYKERYIRYTDSLNKVQRSNRNKYARIQYETTAVENENRTLSTRSITIALISMLVIFALVLLLIFRFIKSQKRELQFKRHQQVADEELFDLLRQHQIQLNHTRQKEQNRISNELHDGIMNKIYGVRLHLGMLNERDDAPSKEKRLHFVDVLQDIEKEVRMISHDLHVDTLYSGGMDYIALLLNIVEQQNELGSTQFTFLCDESIDWDDISGLVKITINRVMQEAISNVTKYADAQHCAITITNLGKELYLHIEDDGKGFDTSTSSDGIGLKSMKDRARTVNGKITVASEPGMGTKIQLLVNKLM